MGLYTQPVPNQPVGAIRQGFLGRHAQLLTRLGTVPPNLPFRVDDDRNHDYKLVRFILLTDGPILLSASRGCDCFGHPNTSGQMCDYPMIDVRKDFFEIATLLA